MPTGNRDLVVECTPLISMVAELSKRVRAAMRVVGADGDPLVTTSQDDRFGDYQSNAAMGAAKRLQRKPRDLAAAIIEHLDVSDMCAPPEIAGPGFINFRIRPEFIAKCLLDVPATAVTEGDRLGIAPVSDPETVVVDLSSPNLAKEMHVGHLRSTVIGDCVCRILEFQGHKVHRENHVGDWGTQFGMLVAYLKRERADVVDHPDDLVIADLESFYVAAKALFDSDDDFKTEARDTVVALQQGDAKTRRIWKAFCDESLRHCHAIYDRLNVRLVDRGESFYTGEMETLAQRLDAMEAADPAGAVRTSDGALCVFMDGFTTRDGDPLPLIVRKRDGGFNYAMSDLATIVHRVEKLGATRIIYVVGLPQKQHFDMVFAAGRKLGWVPENVSLLHMGFGSMLAASGKPFKTRDGGTVKLKGLLDEAVARARTVVDRSAAADEVDCDVSATESRPPLESLDRIAETVALSAVKYFDLSHALVSDYRFDLDTMLALEGNTAPYMLYAYARIQSIARKAGVDLDSLPTAVPINLKHPTEIALGQKILQVGDMVDTFKRDIRPNVLTEYLFELAKQFSRFYDKKLGVRVIDASPDDVRLSRLALCNLTARTLKLGLQMLGVETLEQM